MQYHLILSGSGARFISFVGCLKCLIHNDFPDMINKLASVTGSSGGALIGTAVSLGYSLSFIEKLCLSMQWQDMTCIDVNGFLDEFGLDNGTNFVKLFKSLIGRKLGDSDATFADLYRQTGIVLNITTTNVTKMTPDLMNHVATPNLAVWMALRMTMSIPLLFTAVCFRGDYHVDGAVLNPFPVAACYGSPCTPKKTDTVVAINLQYPEMDNSIVDLVSYIKALTKTLTSRLHAVNYDEFAVRANLLVIKIVTDNQSAFDMDITVEDRKALFDLAYQQTNQIMTGVDMVVKILVRQIFYKIVNKTT